MHEQARRSKSDELNKKMEDMNDKPSSAFVYQVRKRSQSMAEKVIKGHDSYEFEIPNFKTPPSTPPESRIRSKTMIGAIDLSLYHNGIEEEHCEVADVISDKVEIGKLSFQILHDIYNHRITIEILSLDVKSVPSSFVKGSNWVIKPIFKIEIRKQHNSPTAGRKVSTVKRKTSVFQSIQKAEHVFTTIGNSCELLFKHKNPGNFSVRIAVYDISWKHDSLPIGYVHLPITNKLETETKWEETLSLTSEPEQKVAMGEAQIKLCWNPQENTVTIYLMTVENLISKISAGKEYHMKITTFIGNMEYSDYKTVHVEGKNSTIGFNETIKVHIESPHKMEDVAIVLQLIGKQLISNEWLGQAVIGPYMIKTMEDNLSAWEKLLISPFKIVSYNALLYV